LRVVSRLWCKTIARRSRAISKRHRKRRRRGDVVFSSAAAREPVAV
jgi:hypothetical protein